MRGYLHSCVSSYCVSVDPLQGPNEGPIMCMQFARLLVLTDWYETLLVGSAGAGMGQCHIPFIEISSVVSLLNCTRPPCVVAGQCLSYDNMRDVLAFCRDEELVLIADEVYQVRGARDLGGEVLG